MIFFAYTLGALSIIGVPPLIGSWSKLFLVIGSLEADFLFVAILLGISSLLNIYYLLDKNNGITNIRWVSLNTLDQKFSKMFNSASIQQRILAN